MSYTYTRNEFSIKLKRTIHRQHGQNSRAIHPYFECMHPEEGYCWRRTDATAIDVTRRACDNATNGESNKYARVLKERGTKELDKYNCCKREEAKTDELRRSPSTQRDQPPLLSTRVKLQNSRERTRGVNVWTQREEAVLWAKMAIVAAATPVQHAAITN
jgi:hypothetical protein